MEPSAARVMRKIGRIFTFCVLKDGNGSYSLSRDLDIFRIWWSNVFSFETRFFWKFLLRYRPQVFFMELVSGDWDGQFNEAMSFFARRKPRVFFERNSFVVVPRHAMLCSFKRRLIIIMLTFILFLARWARALRNDSDGVFVRSRMMVILLLAVVVCFEPRFGKSFTHFASLYQFFTDSSEPPTFKFLVFLGENIRRPFQIYFLVLLLQISHCRLHSPNFWTTQTMLAVIKETGIDKDPVSLDYNTRIRSRYHFVKGVLHPRHSFFKVIFGN